MIGGISYHGLAAYFWNGPFFRYDNGPAVSNRISTPSDQLQVECSNRHTARAVWGQPSPAKDMRKWQQGIIAFMLVLLGI